MYRYKWIWTLWGENRAKWNGQQSPWVKPRTTLVWATSVLPLSHDSQTTTNPHTYNYVLHRRYYVKAFSTTCAVHIEDCEGMWSPGYHGDCQPFHFPLFSCHNVQIPAWDKILWTYSIGTFVHLQLRANLGTIMLFCETIYVNAISIINYTVSNVAVSISTLGCLVNLNTSILWYALNDQLNLVSIELYLPYMTLHHNLMRYTTIHCYCFTPYQSRLQCSQHSVCWDHSGGRHEAHGTLCPATTTARHQDSLGWEWGEAWSGTILLKSMIVLTVYRSFDRNIWSILWCF